MYKNSTEPPAQNILPYDGELYYYGPILSSTDIAQYMQMLEDDIQWQSESIKIYGKVHTPNRKVAWYADQEYEFRYSGSIKTARLWHPRLLYLKRKVEDVSHSSFNSCLLNRYPDGSSYLGWHSDDERDLQPDGTIASLSFGEERRFVFRHKLTKEKLELILQDSSLLIMAGTIQKHWEHTLPKAMKIKTPRINLTFRQAVGLHS